MPQKKKSKPAAPPRSTPISLAELGSGKHARRRVQAGKPGKPADEPIGHDGGDGGPEVPAIAPEPSAPPKGLVCKRCGCRHFYVRHTRLVSGRVGEKSGMISRERECRNCGRRVWTRERME